MISREARESYVVRVTDETMPIICFQSAGLTTEAQLAAVQPVYDRIYQRKAPFITVSDARFADHSAAQRRMWAAWLASGMAQDVHNNAVGTVVILDSALLRGALVALNWITPPKIPQDVAADWNEAIVQARGIAEHNGMRVHQATWAQVFLWLSQGNRYKSG
jgi:hypothetical protein